MLSYLYMSSSRRKNKKIRPSSIILSLFGAIVVGAILLFILTDFTPPRCYQIESDGTILQFEHGSDGAFIKVTDADGSDPQITYGELNDTAFNYKTGSSFLFGDGIVTGSGGFIEGIQANEIACP